MKHVRRQAALSVLVICLVFALIVSAVFDGIFIAVSGWEHSPVMITGQLVIAILSTGLLKYVIDASPLYWALSGDISRGALRATQVGDTYIILRAKGADGMCSIEITSQHHCLVEVDPLSATIRYAHTGEVIPIGSFGAFLLLLKARKVARREPSKQIPVSEHVKRWRGGGKS